MDELQTLAKLQINIKAKTSIKFQSAMRLEKKATLINKSDDQNKPHNASPTKCKFTFKNKRKNFFIYTFR